ncbi:NAD(P)-dependent alcohol dehydrogenase [Cytobacillus firmus]|uniref:NAD(P)-dependent alcohol dehydrogenase n=1 Tax=Cytobacillus firmus TaxID=1399 RepID=UPI0028F717B9|nr:NAD(P)-dependent alcohol dehydrogenase [Cytobacillus firmus]
MADLDKPVPRDQEVLVKIHAASVNYGNLVLLKGKPYLARFAYGLLKPKHTVPGGDIAGQVEAVGKDVTQFRPGDNVYGDLSGCGWSGFAEYVSVPEKALTIKPANLTFKEAAAVPMAGVTALQALRNKGNIQAGQNVLIYGASGGVGTFAVQIAKSFGAEVTGLCSTRNLDILRTIGADPCHRLYKGGFRQKDREVCLILAVNGYQPISAYKRALKSNGTYVLSGGSGAQFTQAMVMGPWISFTGNKKMSSTAAEAKSGRPDLHERTY